MHMSQYRYVYIYLHNIYIYYLVIQPLDIIEEKDSIPCQQCGGNEELKECVECMDNFCPKCFVSHIKDKHVDTFIYTIFLYIYMLYLYMHIIHNDIYKYI